MQLIQKIFCEDNFEEKTMPWDSKACSKGYPPFPHRERLCVTCLSNPEIVEHDADAVKLKHYEWASTLAAATVRTRRFRTAEH